MKNSAKNSSFANRLAKAQNNGVVSAYKSSIIRWKADVLTIATDSGRTYNVLAYYDLSKDAIIVAIPQTGLPEQGKDRVLPVATSDSAKAEFRAKKILAVSKVEKEINLMCNGRSWAEVVNICGGATRSYKDKNGNVVTKDCYGKISAQSEGLKTRQSRAIVECTKYFNNLEKRASARKAQANTQATPATEAKAKAEQVA